MAPLHLVAVVGRYQRERSGGIYTFETERVFFSPICRTAAWLVFLENRSYAGFATEREARDAVELWKSFWPAARGKVLTILPRVS